MYCYFCDGAIEEGESVKVINDSVVCNGSPDLEVGRSVMAHHKCFKLAVELVTNVQNWTDSEECVDLRI